MNEIQDRVSYFISLDAINTSHNLRKFKHFSDIASQSTFNPQELLLIQFPSKDVIIHISDKTTELPNRYLKESYVFMPVHPRLFDEILKQFDFKSVEKLPVRVLSNLRTFFVNDSSYPHYVKVHYPYLVSSAIRNLTIKDVKLGQRLTDDLKLFSMTNDKFDIFPDAMGLSVPKYNLSAIIRDFYPSKGFHNDTIIVPGSALVSSCGKETLLSRLTSSLNRKLDDYLFSEIISPHLLQWFDMVDNGILFLSHGQNVVF